MQIKDILNTFKNLYRLSVFSRPLQFYLSAVEKSADKQHHKSICMAKPELRHAYPRDVWQQHL